MGNGKYQKIVSVLIGALTLLNGAQAAIPPAGSQTATQLDKVGDEIANVEREILAGDVKSVQQQVQRIRKLIKLQRQEIHLTEQRVKELNQKVESIGIRKSELEALMKAQANLLRSQLQRLAVLTENRLEDKATPSLDALWLTQLDFDLEKGRYIQGLTQKQLRLLKQLRVDREEVLALESQISEEKNSLEFSVQELKEKESLLVANEKIQIEMLRNKRQIAKEELSKLSRLRELRESERGIRKVINQVLPATNQSVATLAALKGQLPMPLSGQIVSQFGRHYDAASSLLTFQKGISILGDLGSEVKTIFKGKVVFAGSLKNYGQMVIVEHPGQYFSLYGQLGDLRVKEGVEVDAGESVGRANKAGTPVYFEIRDRNVAINPSQWLNVGVVAIHKP